VNLIAEIANALGDLVHRGLRGMLFYGNDHLMLLTPIP